MLVRAGLGLLCTLGDPGIRRQPQSRAHRVTRLSMWGLTTGCTPRGSWPRAPAPRTPHPAVPPSALRLLYIESHFSSAQQEAMWLFLEGPGLRGLRKQQRPGISTSAASVDPDSLPTAQNHGNKVYKSGLCGHPVSASVLQARVQLTRDRRPLSWPRTDRPPGSCLIFPKLRPRGLWLTHMELRSATTGQPCQY